jgi:hypothetical protein
VSQAGILSSRGDYYQILVATHWLIRLLREPENLRWVDVEAVALPDSTQRVMVDDIAIELMNGKRIFIQTKKNQSDFKAWSLNDLKEELIKAKEQWKDQPTAELQFFSRTEFGDLRKLHESSKIYRHYKAFISAAPQNLRNILEELAVKVAEPVENAFSLVSQLRFGPTQDFDDWERQNLTALADFLPHARTGIAVLQSLILKEQGRTGATNGPLTRSDVIDELEHHGIAPGPVKAESEILRLFHKASGIGRPWERNIAGHRIPTAHAQAALDAITAGKPTVLLTGGPGSGKTCVLLDIVDMIESGSDIALLFIKADHFKDAKLESDLTAAGLPEDVVGLCARISECRRVVVAIDSLDVLSLTRHHASLGLFLALIDRISRLKNISVVAACRKFDLRYDPQLRARKWEESIEIGNLDFEMQVAPFLRGISVDPTSVPLKTSALLTVPNILKLYVTLREHGILAAAVTSDELFEIFIQELVLKNTALGVDALKLLYRMAKDQLSSRISIVPRARFAEKEEMVAALCSLEILAERQLGTLEFAHQTWGEVLSVRSAIEQGQTLNEFIESNTPLPFIRPAVRAFFFYLRAKDPQVFSRYVRTVINNPAIPYHLKRLIAESFAELKPDKNDWRIIRDLSDNHADLFRRLMWKTKSSEWFLFFKEHWITHVLGKENSDELQMVFVSRLHEWMNIHPEEVIDLWRQALKEHWGNRWQIRWQITVSLAEFKAWSTPGIRELLEILLSDHQNAEREFLGKPISLFVAAANTGDDLLWSWITSDCKNPTRIGLNSSEDLHCHPHELCSPTFLKERLLSSEGLLNAALTSIIEWSEQAGQYYRFAKEVFNGLLHHTSWERDHADRTHHHADGVDLLFVAFEEVVAAHVKKNSAWWQQHKESFMQSPDLALRHIFIRKTLLNIDNNITGISCILTDRALFEDGTLSYELSQMMNAAYPYLSDDVRSANQDILLSLHQGVEDNKIWVVKKKCAFISSIPAPYRSEQAQTLLQANQKSVHVIDVQPEAYIQGGFVKPPITVEELTSLTDQGILKLLKFFEISNSGTSYSWGGDFVGGKEEVLRQLETAASLDPERFSVLCEPIYRNIRDIQFLAATIGGLADHILYLNGRQARPQAWEPKTKPQTILLAQEILKWLKDVEELRAIRNEHRVQQAFMAVAETVIYGKDIEHMLALLKDNLQIPSPPFEQSDKELDLLHRALNSVKGRTAITAITLSNRLLSAGRPLPPSLVELLKSLSVDESPVVRAAVLYELSFIVVKTPNLGWYLFRSALTPIDAQVWPYVERVLYSQYYGHYPEVAPWLERLEIEGHEDAMAGWGRLLTLSCLAGHLDFETLVAKLERRMSEKAWEGSAQVFIANLERRESTLLCQKGILYILTSSSVARSALKLTDRMFLDAGYPFITHEMARRYLVAVESDENKHNLHGFLDWLARAAKDNPAETLQAAELLVKAIQNSDEARQLWNKESLLPALTAILREADESDDPDFIRRAIDVQDTLLKLDIHGIHELYDLASQA